MLVAVAIGLSCETRVGIQIFLRMLHSAHFCCVSRSDIRGCQNLSTPSLVPIRLIASVVEVQSFLTEGCFFPWDHLESARYRRLLNAARKLRRGEVKAGGA